MTTTPNPGALIALGVKKAGCMAHARRKFFDLTTQPKSQIASEALEAVGELYGIEREAAELDIDARQRLRDVKARPLLERLHAWLLARRTQVPNGSGIARAISRRGSTGTGPLRT